MKKLNFIIAIFIAGSALISCEANKLISLTVIDKITKQPIDSVLIEVKAGKNGDYNKSHAKGFTNTLGKFETHMMIGCALGCYDIYLEYDKSGYVHKKELNKTEGLVELEQ